MAPSAWLLAMLYLGIGIFTGGACLELRPMHCGLFVKVANVMSKHKTRYGRSKDSEARGWTLEEFI
jgi:hypothetical protein